MVLIFKKSQVDKSQVSHLEKQALADYWWKQALADLKDIVDKYGYPHREINEKFLEEVQKLLHSAEANIENTKLWLSSKE